MEEIRVRIDNDKYRKIIFNSLYENFDIPKELKMEGKYIIYIFQNEKNKRAIINSFLKSIDFLYKCLVIIDDRSKKYK